MKPVFHIVGGGIAGLSAALTAVDHGANAVIYEASPHIGGRCRPLISSDFPHGQGAHLLMSGDTHTLALLERIGARQHWIEVEHDGLPIYNAETGLFRRVGLSPWSWRHKRLRPENLNAQTALQLLRLLTHVKDRPASEFIGKDPFLRSFVEPLATTLLNTPLETASSRRLAQVLQRFLKPGSSRLLAAADGIAADLILPLFSVLRQFKTPLRTAMRLTAIERTNGRATGLIFGRRRLLLEAADRVVLALPSREIGRLFPTLNVPTAFEPILTAHFAHNGPERPRFFALPSPLLQWVIARKSHVSVTVPSAAGIIDENADDLGKRFWRSIAPALNALGYPADPEQQPETQIVKERRATIRQDTLYHPQSDIMPLSNVVLSGDWLQPNPTTIESAVRSGEAAAMRCLEKQVEDDPTHYMNAAFHW